MKKDVALQSLIKKEIRRQKETINLIASENFVSPEILKILGSPLTNKYSEGYPAKRYYAGNQYCDEIENLARERALKVFKLNPKVWSVNVQPYSGTPANLEIYFALLNFGDTLMGMNLASGGHLSHGYPANFSGKAYRVISYGVDPKTNLLDYQELKKLALKHKPRLIISGASAYPRKIDFKKIGQVARKVNAYHLADISHIAGLVAAELHPSPFAFSDVVMTTTHKTLRGPRGAVIFSKKKKMIYDSRFMIHDVIDKAVFPGMQGGPHNNVIAAIAAAFFEAWQPEFKSYQKQIIKNARALGIALKNFGFNLVTGGTDNHLLLINLKNLNINGFTAEKKLEAVGIIANRNVLFGDKNPFKPSGLRLGTAAVTTQGMKEKEMGKIAKLICRKLMVKK